MRTHNEGGVVTGIEAALMQIDPQRPKCQSLLIKLFTTREWQVLCMRDTNRVDCRISAATQCENLPINERKKR